MILNSVPVSIIGASGYVGGELLRLLLNHPFVDLKYIVSETYTGKELSESFPGMIGNGLKFSSFNKQEIIENSKVVFFAQDHGAAISQVPDFINAGIKVIDLSADFRLKDPQIFKQWYKQEHTALPELQKAVYGLPEIFKEQIKSASLIANPGCYPTASVLGLYPALKNSLIDADTIVIDAKSGVSGAGRAKHNLDLHFPELNQNFKAYGVAGTHRHTPEIEQILSKAADRPLTVSFTPHLLPVNRGILASCYAKLIANIELQEIINLYRNFYKDQPFVRVLEAGQLASTKACYASNLCIISIAVDYRTNRISVFSAIDNLTKGAAGQAVQNFNIISGFDEILALNLSGVWP